ncbi:MAG: SGNH/GDSL hydrolase family protein [Proteobacteria bacterium]|nr:SGNH/GDSL hydrolase family protein [Pseudomonadota bacterium]
MKRLRTIAIVFLIILPLDVGVAQFCRANCAFWKNTYPPGDHRVRSEDYHHGLAPNRWVTEAWGLSRYRYATNSLGFKDSEPRTVEPKGGGARVLFLGDSFTEGKGFAFAETFVGLVASELAGRGIEVLNGAVDSYSPVIYRQKVKHLLEKVGLRFDALVVFLDVSDILNEARDYPLDGEGRLIVPLEETEALWASLRFLRDNSATARLVSVAYDYASLLTRIAWTRVKIARALGKWLFDVDEMDFWIYLTTDLRTSAWTFDDARWRDYGAVGRQRAAAQMDALWSLLQDRGIPLVLAVYPWPDQLFNDPQAPRHQGFWRQWSEDRGVEFISLFPAFTEGKPRDVLQRYFIPYDHHWNAEGHQLVARIFLEQFRPPSARER